MEAYNPESRYYEPTITVAEIENWLNCSYRTACRRMAQMKKDLHIGRYEKPLRTIAKRYFRIEE